MNLQTDAVPKKGCVVITTRKFRSQKLQKPTPTIVNSSNAYKTKTKGGGGKLLKEKFN